LLVFIDSEFAFNIPTLHLLAWGALFNPYTLDGDGWRIFSCMFLHGGLIHLGVNMHSLWSLGSVQERKLQSLKFFLLYLLSGIGSSLASLYFNNFVISVGASGAIFGLYGFYIISALMANYGNKKNLSSIVVNFAIFLGVNLIFAKAFNVDMAGHIGGFVTGIFIAGFQQYLKGKLKYSYRFYYVAGFLVILYTSIFFLLPRWQVEYFKTFQHLIHTEDKTEEVLVDLETDAEVLEGLKRVLPIWQKTLNKFKNFPFHLPSSVESDRLKLLGYIQLRTKVMEYKVTGIERESVIYFDSVNIVTERLNAMTPVKYSLRLSEPKNKATKQEPVENNPLELTKVFYDSSWKETYETNAVYYRIGAKDSLGLWSGFVTDYYLNGKIQMKGKYLMDLQDGIFIYYSSEGKYQSAGIYDHERKVGKWEYFHENGRLASEVRHAPYYFVMNVWDEKGNSQVINGEGIERTFYPNGDIKSETPYKEGVKNGTAIGYNEKGDKWFMEAYRNGTLIQGKSKTEDGSKYTYDESVLYPVPESGFGSFYKYIDQNKQYPPEALENKLYGKLTVLFTVEIDGTLSDIKFLNRLGLGYEEEVKRLLLSGPKWTPAKNHGFIPYRSMQRITIEFPKKNNGSH